MPGIEQLGLGRRHEQVALFGLTIFKSGLAVLEDMGARRQPGGVPATRAEALAAADPIAARHHDRLGRWHRRVRDDAARRVDPDQASDVARHSRRVGREDRALIDDPAGAGVGFAELLEHLDVGRQVDLRAAQSARQRQLEQAGVGQRLEQRPRQLPVGLDLIGEDRIIGASFRAASSGD